MRPVIRLGNGDDAASVQAIYAPIVRETAISFELEIPDVPEMRRRILSTSESLPWLVCGSDGGILGYAYAGPHRTRAAYQWAVEVSVYVHADARQMGVGRALYRSLFDLLTLQGFRNAFAGITLPNPASVRLHESFAFQSIGVYRNVGYKFGRWHGVEWWQLPLGEHDSPPGPPAQLPGVAGSTAWNAAMDSGLSLLRL